MKQNYYNCPYQSFVPLLPSDTRLGHSQYNWLWTLGTSNHYWVEIPHTDNIVFAEQILQQKIIIMLFSICATQSSKPNILDIVLWLYISFSLMGFARLLRSKRTILSAFLGNKCHKPNRTYFWIMEVQYGSPPPFLFLSHLFANGGFCIVPQPISGRFIIPIGNKIGTLQKKRGGIFAVSVLTSSNPLPSEAEKLHPAEGRRLENGEQQNWSVLLARPCRFLSPEFLKSCGLLKSEQNDG